MDKRFILNATKFNHYINENKGWQKMLELQINEIPDLNKMLSATTTETRGGRSHFSKQLSQQKNEMELLNNEIDKQQKRLFHDLDNENEAAFDIDTFCSEDILRERIRAIEKNYIELKSDFMKYMSSII